MFNFFRLENCYSSFYGNDKKTGFNFSTHFYTALTCLKNLEVILNRKVFNTMLLLLGYQLVALFYLVNENNVKSNRTPDYTYTA